MRDQYQDSMEMTPYGLRFPAEFSCAIHTIMSHVYGETGAYLGSDNIAAKELNLLFAEMKYFVAPVIVAGTIRPEQWNLDPP